MTETIQLTNRVASIADLQLTKEQKQVLCLISVVAWSLGINPGDWGDIVRHSAAIEQRVKVLIERSR
jgi:hypothetical protein